MTDLEQELKLELRNVSKRYANGMLANDGVSLQVRCGEIHALIGENGAGKSTVMKMLYGLEQPSAGQLLLDGRPLQVNDPRAAIAAGIGLVPQHLQLVPSFSVAQNVVLGDEPLRNGLVDMRQAVNGILDVANRFGLEIDPNAVASSLSLGEQQRVEILKTLYRGASLILLDEPTAVLTPSQCEALFSALRALTRQGLTVLLITHKLSEVMEVSDRYTVLRGGRVTGTGGARDVSAEALTSMIVGREVPALQAVRVSKRGEDALLSVRGLSVLNVDGSNGQPLLDGVSFDIAAGEILGVAGVEGNGQSALADVLGGLRTPDAGRVTLAGLSCFGLGVRAARAAGVAAIPEDRLHNGVALDMSIADNMIAADYHLPPLSRLSWMRVRAVAAMARGLMERFGVVAQGPDQPTGALSGGNMQKVVMARELAGQPRFLVASQPTRGVDIGAAQSLRRQLMALRDSGAAVLLISADLDEVMQLSDRIAVLAHGRIAGHFKGGEVGVGQLGACMTGAQSEHGTSAALDAPFTELREVST